MRGYVQEEVVDSEYHSEEASKEVKDYASGHKEDLDKVQNNDKGEGSVDNDKEQITLDNLDDSVVRSLASIKARLLRLIDDITKVENNRQSSLEKQEQESNEAALRYKSQLKDEIRKLTKRNEILDL